MKRQPDSFPHEGPGGAGARYDGLSKADWADAYADLFRQLWGLQATAEEILDDVEHRDALLRRAAGRRPSRYPTPATPQTRAASAERGPESWYVREPYEGAREAQPASTTHGALALVPQPAPHVVIQPVPALVDPEPVQLKPLPAQYYAALMGFEPSAYQCAIFDFVQHGEGDGIVNAVAGSGKTSTLVAAAKLLRAPALFAAFNKHIADELALRLSGTPMLAKTMHSIGYGCIAKHLDAPLKMNDRKYQQLCWRAVEQTIVRSAGPEQQKAVTALRKLVDFTRLTLTDPDDRAALVELVDHYGIEIDSAIPHLILDAVPDILREGLQLAEGPGHIIDYTDMVYLPARWHLTPPQLAYVMVDECQDLNAAQLDLALKCRQPGGRMLFVGDSKQSIYGFTGADAQSYDNIKRRTHATELPLSICYRCPRSVVELARAIVPQIEAAPDAPEGIVGTVRADELAQFVQEGDLILCRLTAPLVAECLRLIGQRIGARVRGRDIGKQLCDVVRAVQQFPDYSWDRFATSLGDYEATQRHKLLQREGTESAQEALADRCEAVRVCFDNFHATSADGLCADIEGLFSEDKAVVNLSTVHRAKGLEEERVLILRPDKLPLAWPKQRPWEQRQEENLRYVALTRAKAELHFVEA